jgi:hypothetical protein
MSSISLLSVLIFIGTCGQGLPGCFSTMSFLGTILRMSSRLSIEGLCLQEKLYASKNHGK